LVADQVVICPICEAQYKVLVTIDGKMRLEDFACDETDLGEL